jgi:hypothetical protein
MVSLMSLVSLVSLMSLVLWGGAVAPLAMVKWQWWVARGKWSDLQAVPGNEE